MGVGDVGYTARPDGSGGRTREADLCYAGAITCPSCGRKLPDVHVYSDGAAFLHCSKRVANPQRASGGTRWCGQHVFVSCTSGSVCAVVPISREEFEHYRHDDRPAWQLMRELGVLTEPDGRAA